MRRTHWILLFVSALQAAPNSTLAQAVQTLSPVNIARDLRSGDRDRIASALSHIPLKLDPSAHIEWGFPDEYLVPPEVSSGLIAALAREADLYMDGATVLADTHPELVIELMHYVVALRDPASVPILLRLLGTGTLVRDALLSFGPDVISDLADVAVSAEAHADHVRGALLALRDAAARFESRLTPSVRRSMRRAAILNLDGVPGRLGSVRERSSALVGAIILAEQLRDPDVTARLVRIAGGTGDPGMAWIPDDVRARAADVLRRLR